MGNWTCNTLAIHFADLCLIPVSAQNLNASNGDYEKTRMIDGKKFHVAYYEHEVKKSMDE